MVGKGLIAGVLDDAFAHGEGEVEAAKAGVTLFETGHDAQGMQIVVETEAMCFEGCVESLFSGMTEGWMADVVDQREGFGEGGVEAESCGDGAGNLGYFEGVGEAAAGVVAFCAAPGEDLSFAGQAAKGFGMQDTAGVAHEGGAVGMGRFGISSKR